MEIRRELLQFGAPVQMSALHEGTEVLMECACGNPCCEGHMGTLDNLMECTCDSPCCEVDIGVGYVACGGQHCPVHGTPENQGVPSFRTYVEGSLHGVDTVQGSAINERPHGLGPGEEWYE